MFGIVIVFGCIGQNNVELVVLGEKIVVLIYIFAPEVIVDFSFKPFLLEKCFRKFDSILYSISKCLKTLIGLKSVS